MKNNDCLADFFAFAAIAFSEKEKTERSQAEKQCRCTGNNCKNQHDFHKELLADIDKCKALSFDVRKGSNITLFRTLCDIEQKLLSARE